MPVTDTQKKNSMTSMLHLLGESRFSQYNMDPKKAVCPIYIDIHKVQFMLSLFQVKQFANSHMTLIPLPFITILFQYYVTISYLIYSTKPDVEKKYSTFRHLNHSCYTQLSSYLIFVF